MNHAPDQLIDQVLQALRDTEAPVGLEHRVAARIATRIAEAADARTRTTSSSALGRTPASLFAVLLNAVSNLRIVPGVSRLYAFAATAAAILITVSLVSFTSHRQPTTIAQSNSLPVFTDSQAPSQPGSPTQAAARTHSVPTDDGVPSDTMANDSVAKNVAANESVANSQVPQGFSLGSHNPNEGGGGLTPTPTDLDTIALAETHAPSHPAPRMPLTAQELLLVRATRQGQPIQIAELETLHDSALRSLAEAHQRSTIRQYIQGLLGPLASAQALDPTSPSPSSDEAKPSTSPDPSLPPLSK